MAQMDTQDKEKTAIALELAKINQKLTEIIQRESWLETTFTQQAGGVSTLKISVVAKPKAAASTNKR